MKLRVFEWGDRDTHNLNGLNDIVFILIDGWLNVLVEVVNFITKMVIRITGLTN